MLHRTYFSRLFWGFALTILDFRVGSVDFLPDSLGYILIALGAGALNDLSGKFGVARGLSWILVPLSLVGDVHAIWMLGNIRTLLDSTMLWFLLGGIMTFAASQGRPDIAKRASNRRIACVLLTLVGLFIEATGELAVPLAFAAVLLTLMLLAMILHLLYQVRVQLSGAGVELAPNQTPAPDGWRRW